MKFVLDASVAAKVLIPEADSQLAENLLESYKANVHELIAPDILPIELGHTLTRAERIGTLQQGEAFQQLMQFLRIRPKLFAHFPLLPEAVALSSKTRIGVYDAVYCVLAEHENCELITSDQKLFNALKLPYIRLLDSL